MEQTTQCLYLPGQVLAGIRSILVANCFTALPGQGLLNATVTQVLLQIVTAGLLPFSGVFSISFTARIMEQTGLDQ